MYRQFFDLANDFGLGLGFYLFIVFNLLLIFLILLRYLNYQKKISNDRLTHYLNDIVCTGTGIHKEILNFGLYYDDFCNSEFIIIAKGYIDYNNNVPVPVSFSKLWNPRIFMTLSESCNLKNIKVLSSSEDNEVKAINKGIIQGENRIEMIPKKRIIEYGDSFSYEVTYGTTNDVENPGDEIQFFCVTEQTNAIPIPSEQERKAIKRKNRTIYNNVLLSIVCAIISLILLVAPIFMLETPIRIDEFSGFYITTSTYMFFPILFTIFSIALMIGAEFIRKRDVNDFKR